MIQPVSIDQRLSVISSRVCSVPSSDKNAPGDSRVAEVKLKVDFAQFERFHCQLDGRSDCCSCHLGAFSTHLNDDELQIVAVWYPDNEGHEANLDLMTQSDAAGDYEVATWKIVAGDAQPADDVLFKRARSLQLQMLMRCGTCLQNNKDWIAETLHTANRLRARHGAPALQWSPKAATEARKVADKLAEAAKKGKHMVGTTALTTGADCFKRGLGQAIHLPLDLKPGELNDPKNAIIDWYQQQFNPGYDFARSGKIPGTADFTQLVWTKTTHIGMDCDSQGQGYIVACFSPPGNMNGEFGENVQQAKGAKERSICKARFQAFDKNGDNHLSSVELETMLRTLDPSFSHKEIEYVMKFVDKNGSGKVDFDEFLNWTFPSGVDK